MKASRIASALGLAIAAAFPAAASAQNITLMTGPQGGVWVPLGGQLKSMWEKAIPGLNVTATPGAGIANVRGVDEGKALRVARKLGRAARGSVAHLRLAHGQNVEAADGRDDVEGKTRFSQTSGRLRDSNEAAHAKHRALRRGQEC